MPEDDVTFVHGLKNSLKGTKWCHVIAGLKHYSIMRSQENDIVSDIKVIIETHV